MAKKCLPDYLRPVLAIGYFPGWRVQKIISRKRSPVDLENGKVWLEKGKTKNGEGREIYLDADLVGTLKVLSARRNPLCPYVFQHGGNKIKRFTKAWKTACIKAGLSEPQKDKASNITWKVVGRDSGGKAIRKTIEVPTKIFHGLRRTAARDDVRAGSPS